MALDYVPDYVSPEVQKHIIELHEKGTKLKACPVQVNTHAIRHWVETLEDGNPLYSNEEYAKKSPYGGIVAPPCTLPVWWIPYRWPWPPPEGGGESTTIIQQIKMALDLPVTVSVSVEQEFYLPMKVGDKLFKKEVLVSINPWEKTSFGEGHTYTVDILYYNQAKELVAKERATSFSYGRKAKKSSGATLKGGWNVSVEEALQGERSGYQQKPSKPVRYEDVKVGDELPSIFMPVTATRSVFLASATRDFAPVHSNRDYAQQRGKMRDMWVNRPFMAGLVSRLLTDWAGPEAIVRKIWVGNIQGSVCAGDDMTVKGKVSKKYIENKEHLVEVEVMFHTQNGAASPCSGTVALPSKGSGKAKARA